MAFEAEEADVSDLGSSVSCLPLVMVPERPGKMPSSHRDGASGGGFALVESSELILDRQTGRGKLPPYPHLASMIAHARNVLVAAADGAAGGYTLQHVSSSKQQSSLQFPSGYPNRYCSRALQLLGSLMVLMVIGVVGFSYYAVVICTYGPLLTSGSVLKAIGGSIVSLVFTFVAGMITWAYLATVTADPGRVPPGWHPFADDQQARVELERLAYSNYYFDRRDPRRPRFCKRCQAWKPERAHHCSVSGHCILKMDHYCIWVVNCVGLLNYKFFLLFLFYALVGAVSCFLLLLSSMIQFVRGRQLGPSSPFVFISFILNFAFSIALAGFIIMHLQMLAANCSTIEMYEKDRVHPWPYNKGFRRNFEEVFGRSKWRWMLPMHSKEEKRVLLDSCLSHQAGAVSKGASVPFLSSVSHV